MARTITLDSIAEAVDKKYGPVDIPLPEGGYARLHPIIRLSSAERSAFAATQTKMNQLQDRADAIQSDDAEGADDRDIVAEGEALQVEILELLRELYRIVGRRTVYIERLLEHFGEDFATLMTAFQMYAGDTELGEA